MAEGGGKFKNLGEGGGKALHGKGGKKHRKKKKFPILKRKERKIFEGGKKRERDDS